MAEADLAHRHERPDTPPPWERLIAAARWAPSGDNTQPWRFDQSDPLTLRVHTHDTHTHCVYDLDGHASQLAWGAMFETLALAASVTGWAATPTLESSSADGQARWRFDLAPLDASASTRHQDARLAAAIPVRSVHRFVLSTRPMPADILERLSAALPPGYTLQTFSGSDQRLRWARLWWDTAGLRLRLPEAYPTHRDIIDWDCRYSPDRVPDQALGAAAPTRVMMRWALTSWGRVHALNRWLGGTIAPRIEMDARAAWYCGAHIAIVAAQAPGSDLLAHMQAGRAVQRFWLQAAAEGLQHQPAMTPIVFRRYVQTQRPFTVDAASQRRAVALGSRLERTLPDRTPADHVVWLGRLGFGPPWPARSTRLSLEELTLTPTAKG